MWQAEKGAAKLMIKGKFEKAHMAHKWNKVLK